MAFKYKNLMTPIRIGKVQIKNRYAMGAMGGRFYMFGEKGSYTKNGIAHFTKRARGGFGLIITGSNVANLTVDPFDPVNGNPNPAYAPGVFKHGAQTLTERVHAYGSKIFMQISMGPGRMRNGKSCSPIPRYKDPNTLTEELTVEEIHEKVRDMGKLAKLARDWGFDGVEVHGMHWGYLLDQFAMSYTNHRTDEYGGDLEGRLRIHREILECIKDQCGEEFPVAIRMCMKTYMAGYNKATLDGTKEVGRTIEEACEIAKLFEKWGYDMLDVNSGTYDSFYYCVSPYYMENCYNIELAAKLKEVVDIPIFVAGAMDDPDICEKAIADGKIDGVTLARAALVDAQYPNKVAQDRVDDIRPCIRCTNCIHTNLKDGVPKCSVNPAAMRERDYAIIQAAKKKRIAVIGGGAAGMEAAMTASLAGHDVTLYEKEDKLGGHLLEAGSHPFKKSIQHLTEWYVRQMDRTGVKVKTGVKADPKLLIDAGFEVAILAAGSDFFVPPVPGKDHEKVLTVDEVLMKEKEVGKKVVIVGGGLTGCELAYELSGLEGRDVTIVEGLSDILSSGAPVPDAVRSMLTELLYDTDTNIRTGCMIAAVNDDGAVIRDAMGNESTIRADNVIFAIGLRPKAGMADDFLGSPLEVYQIGDYAKVGNIRSAVATAYEIARNI